MKLTKIQITNFRSIEDSTPFEIGDITCLVGKNESGKTNILRCLERINPIDPTIKRAQFSEDYDWPRNVDDPADPDAEVIEATWVMDKADMAGIYAKFGAGCLSSDTVKQTFHFGGSITCAMPLNETVVRSFLWNKFGLTAEEQASLAGKPLDELATHIAGITPPNPRLTVLADYLKAFRDSRPVLGAIDALVYPKFLYFEQYDRLGGRIAIEDLRTKKGQNPATLTRKDHLFLNFLDFAGVQLEELQNPKTAEAQISRLERAQTRITNSVFAYWTQNPDLEVKFELLNGRPGDPVPFNTGTVLHTRIYNGLHKMTVPFDERSAGFTWFFSFLVQFSRLCHREEDFIILLDEPGNGLHARAQQDLLRFFEEELKPHHQVIYTTHSPFMVPPANLERVRLVEDVVETKKGRRISLGTSVGSDFLSVSKDTRFPLQSALGFEITQTLWIGPNCLLVEGPSDILYLEAASRALLALGRTGLHPGWTKCPAGGLNKVHAFVSLFSGNALNTAVFLDLSKGPDGSRRELEALRTTGLLQSSHVFSAGDVTGTAEADIEDVWGIAGFLALVNEAYQLDGALKESDIASVQESSPRIVKKVEAWFRLQKDLPEFDHYRPAEWLISNPNYLKKSAKLFGPAFDRFEDFFKRLNPLLKSLESR